MSDNPPLTPDRQPAPIHNEYFVLSRHGIYFSARSGSLKFEGKGQLYLSTLRMIFVSDGRGSMNAFDLPLATMRDEAFNQPIFGANNLTGTSAPLDGSSCHEDIKWKLAFNEGGVGTFLPLFFRLLTEMRAMLSQQQSGTIPTATAIPVATASEMLQAAYVDPNDPTKLYVTQPDMPVAVAVATPLKYD
uniref:GRAM domain-containing protein n=2 Tax=Chrysotila carterae TaxID=13221 RepID=A0A7S4BCM4_CHRCT